MKKTFPIYLLCLLIIGCTSSPGLYEKLVGDNGGLLRGMKIKDGQSTVKGNENDAYLIENQAVYLKYSYPINEKFPEEGSYEIEYYFDGEDQLHEMIMDVFITDKEVSAEVHQKFKEKFTKLYGEPTQNTEGYLVWKGESDNTTYLEIALMDDSKNTETTGYLTIQINDFDY